MTESTKMKCPKCGSEPEVRIRKYGMCMGSAEIRCPYNCLRYGTSFHSGMESATRIKLKEKWEELLAEYAANEKQRSAVINNG